jgi:NitT/TauT family transport system substrate-binding protein
MKRTLSLVLAGVLALSMVAGCSKQQQKPADVYKPGTTAPVAEAPAEGKLKIGQMPTVDGLPFWVADQKGYYKQEGVDVELITFKSANERDAAILSGDIDGMLTDPISTISLVASGTKVKIASLALGATKAEGPMSIVVAPKSGIADLNGLKGVEVAISSGTVMDYTTERLLTDAGFKPEEIKTTNIAQIPIRYDSLINNKIKAALLPQPWASLAVAAGGKVVIDDAKAGKLNYSTSVTVFSEKAMKEKPNAIKRFFIAYNRGVVDLRLNPQGFMDLLIAQAKVPAETKTQYVNVPPSPTQAPKKEDLEDIVQWLLGRKIIKTPVSYEQVVDTSLLPKQ